MEFKVWKTNFIKNKKLVGEFALSSTDAVHSIKRYLDDDGRLWETAITYTNKIVVRNGFMESEQLTIEWNRWETLHEIEFD